MERRDRIDFLREVVRLAEARLDDIYASYDAIGNKARLIVGFSAATLGIVYRFVLYSNERVMDCLWYLGVVAALCLVSSVVLSFLVLKSSGLYLKGVRPSDIDPSIFGGDLAVMLTSLADLYGRKIKKDSKVLRKKGDYLVRAQIAFGAGFALSLIVFAIELIA